METWAIELIKQAPIAGAILIIVRWGLQYLRTHEKERTTYEAGRDKALRETITKVEQECQSTQERALEVMGEVREEMGRSREAQTQLLTFLRSLNGGLKDAVDARSSK